MKLDETTFSIDVLEEIFNLVEIIFANEYEMSVLRQWFKLNSISAFFKFPKLKIICGD